MKKSKVSRRDFLAKSAIGAGAAAALGAVPDSRGGCRRAPEHAGHPGRRRVHQVDQRGADRLRIRREGAERRGSLRARLQEGRAGGAVLLPRQLHRHQRDRRRRHPGVRRTHRRHHVRRGRRLLARHRRSRRVLRHRRSRLHQHDHVDCQRAPRARRCSCWRATWRCRTKIAIGGIQQMYQQPTTEGIKKYGKRITIPNRVHEYAALRLPPVEERRARSGPPRLPVRSFAARASRTPPS